MPHDPRSAFASVSCADRSLPRRTLVIHADDKITVGNAELQFQLGNLLTEETRFREALDAFERAPDRRLTTCRCAPARAR